MDSPPYHYYNHNLHDPTIINVHTLLKPQTYQQPNSITHTLPTQTYPNLTNHSLPPNLPPNTMSILKQILHSQEACLHSMSVCAKTLSTITSDLKTLNTNLAPPSITHNINHTQQQTYVTQNPFYQQQPLAPRQTYIPYTPFDQQPLPSLNNNQNFTFKTEPTPFIITNPTPKQNYFSPIPSHHHQSNTISTSTVSETQTQNTQEPIPNGEIIPTNDFAAKTQFSVTTINKREEPFELVVGEGVFSHTVDSISQVGEEEIKFVPDLVISSHGSDYFEQKLDVVKDLNESFSATTAPSTEKTVVRTVAVTPKQHPQLTFALLSVSIQIFDPGGTLTAAVNHRSIMCRRLTILNFESFAMFTFCYDASFHIEVLLQIHMFLTAWSLPLLWMPWDRGKKSCNYRNIFLHFRRRYPIFHSL